jgi:AcrR family transcriptional regulator
MSRIQVEPPKDYASRIGIVRAIVEIGRAKGIETVTVKDICASAGIARQTFYRHFDDKFDALTWYCDLDLRNSIYQVGLKYTWYEGSARMLQSLYDEADFYRMAFGCYRNTYPLSHFAEQMTFAEWRRTVTEAGSTPLTPSLDYQLKAWSKLAPILGREWFGSLDKSSSVKDGAKMVVRCIPQDLRAVMDEAALARRG